MQPAEGYGALPVDLHVPPQGYHPYYSVLEMRKEKSRDAARSRRGKENYEFYELAKLLPLPAAITSQLDKASIIRLSISYLKLRDFSGRGDPPWSREGPLHTSKGGHPGSRSVGVTVGAELFERHQGTHILQSLDGFAFVLASDARFLYVSETVSIYLGLSQVEMTGSNVFDYVHHQDHAEMAEQMGISLSQASTSPSSTTSDDGSSVTGGPSTPTGPDRPAPIMTLNSNSMYKGLERVFCIRMKSTLTKRGCHFKSSGYRVVLLLTHLRPQYSFSHNRKNPPVIIGMVALAIALPPPSMNEVRLESDMFVTRLTFDFRIVHCEPRVSELLDYTAEEMTGKNMYLLCHGQDVQKLRQCHIDLIHKGQVMSEYYRVMNKTGGYTWIQTCATIICNNKSSEEQSIICVNYVLSGTEYQNYVMDCSQMRHTNNLKSDETSNSEKDNSLDKEGRGNNPAVENIKPIASSPKITRGDGSTESENLNGDALIQLRSSNECTQMGSLNKTTSSENSALSFLEEGRSKANEEDEGNGNETRSEDDFVDERRRKRRLEPPSVSAEAEADGPEGKHSSLEGTSGRNGVFLVDAPSDDSDGTAKEGGKRVARPWRRSPDGAYSRAADDPDAAFAPPPPEAPGDFGPETGCRAAQRSAIQWIGAPGAALPASAFLRQLYANRESVIRSGARPGRPSYYGRAPPAADCYAAQTAAEAYGPPAGYAPAPDCFAEARGAAPSPGDEFRPSPVDVSAFSEAGLSHPRHYAAAEAPPSHLPLKPRVFVRPGSVDPSVYDRQQSYAPHGFGPYHPPTKSSHPANGVAWYPRPHS
ncbi:protein trachealess-like isoform X3 [Centruroides sculpturatus]|uniref:protein trachealess-like isoform X3 n=1 Tax=Centruroides sculpturatus TaxID=218467 RepID=UPI000C6D32AF|nr:protein trachealess-like isoform X3 [Centruroides sculpturatus]